MKSSDPYGEIVRLFRIAQAQEDVARRERWTPWKVVSPHTVTHRIVEQYMYLQSPLRVIGRREPKMYPPCDVE